VELDETLSLKLLAGEPINIPNAGNIYPLTLKEIKEITLVNYNYLLVVLCYKPDVNQSIFNNIITNCKLDFDYQNLVLHALSCFFKDSISILNNKFYIGEIFQNRYLDDSNYNEFYDILKLQNCLLETKEEYNPANEKARELIEKIKKNKVKKPPKKNNINMASIISGIVWKSKTINIFNVWDLTIYQLYDGLNRMDILDNFYNVMHGYFSGTIKKEDIDFKNLSWIKKIDLNN
jgi:hypothetical protein